MILQPAQSLEHLRVNQAGNPEQTQVTCLADAGAYEVTVVTCPATAAAAQADYFYFENQAGDDFAVWLDIDAAGVAPTGAIYTAATTKIEVDIVTGDTAAQVAAKVVTAIGVLFTDVTVVDNLDGTITFTQDKIGIVVNAAPHNANDSAAGSIGVSVSTQGAASTLQNKYFQIQEGDGATNRFVWLNIGAEGVAPAGAGTALEAAVTAGSSASSVATQLAAAITADSDLVAEASGANVLITNAASGNATNAFDGDSGFTISIVNQGYDAQEYNPDSSVTALSNTPSLKVAAS